ncbi:hypothetical protein DUI87_18994 [Hirundo rustica rustica]|uniref:Peptidase A2 domain-containing protein n=1 Tax=Hirundo rustica rustica TaxID=333673 RepID=A0A3M0JTY2_HIRRU|nr:hypothetical protein DUI87_18994 [Hirundo rustica rustica]
MKLIRVSPECCDKCLSTCLEFRLKIEGCAIRGYDIDFNITQVCTEYHKNQTKITPPVPRKAVITKMPAIPEVEEQITPVVTKIGPYAIKKTGVQKLIVNPKWSLKRVEMGVQVNASHVRPECAPFLRNSFMDWTTWLQKSMPPNFRNKRDLTGLLGTGLGVLNTIDSEVLLNKLTTIGSDLVKLQQPLQSSLLALGNNHWKLTKILPEWEDTEERDHEVIINALGTASENISLALGCTQAQLWMQSVAAAVIREGGEGIFPAEIRKIVWDNASDMERELQSWWVLVNFTYNPVTSVIYRKIFKEMSTEEEQGGQRLYFLGDKYHLEPVMTLKMGPQGEELEFVVDTGAERTCLLNVPKSYSVSKDTAKVTGAKGETFTVPVIKDVVIEAETKIWMGDVLLVPKAGSNFLGRDLEVKLGIEVIPEDGKMTAKVLKLGQEDEEKINKEVWAGEGNRGGLNIDPISVTIEREDCPIHVHQYPISLEGREGLKPVIEGLIKDGTLEPFMSPHNTSILPVKKPDGSYRLVS